MKRTILVLMLISCANAWAAKDPEIDDPAQIKAFLSDPRVNSFHYPEPINWKSYRKYIQIGTVLPNGACQFHDETTAQPNQPVLKIETAVDRAGCRSLVIEGTPDPVTWYKFQQYEEYLHKHAKNTGSSAPGIGKTLVIRKDPATQTPQLQLNENTPVDQSTPAAGQASMSAASGGNFNTGGATYAPIYDIQYTDANNALMQGILGDLLKDLAGLLGITLGANGILAAEVGVSQNYGTPSVVPISGNCYYDGQSNGSSVNFTQYGGNVVYRTGSVGWRQTAENACDSMLFAAGSTVSDISSSSTLPGLALGTPAAPACVANARASFANSCVQYGQQIPYVAFGYFTNASGTFFNNLNASPAFDCSANGGLTINFASLQIVSDGAGHATITGDSNYSGPVANCASNLSRIVVNNPGGTAVAN